MTTEMFLVRHGTKAFRLPASAVVATARSDLALRKRKAEARVLWTGPERLPLGADAYPDLAQQHYAFRHEHVAVARDAADLIRRALDDDDWKTSAKASVHILYGDKELLKAALEVAA